MTQQTPYPDVVTYAKDRIRAIKHEIAELQRERARLEQRIAKDSKAKGEQ